MIEFIFTLDYEIYGDGSGSLKEHVLEPATSLLKIFNERNARLVLFVEAAELEVIYNEKTDPAIMPVLEQVHEFYRCGYEIGLHLHPQWYRAKRESGNWRLDGSEYNLCVLPEDRIRQIIGRSVEFLRRVLTSPDYSPFSFRAGNWLFQPTQTAAKILSEYGIRVDSSVFKGGFLPDHGIDYRPALKNGWFWRFSRDAVIAEANGSLLEVPIYTRMVPLWKMITLKRLALQKRKTPAVNKEGARIKTARNIAGLKYPMKLDFCKMTRKELASMLNRIIHEDKSAPSEYHPVVAIGHTKDLRDIAPINYFLGFLCEKGIPITGFRSIYDKCLNA
jgi:hypothetical protein